MVKNVERVEQHSVLRALRKICLQLREVGSALMNHDNLAVEDRPAAQLEGAGDVRKAVGPIVPISSEDFCSTAVCMHLNPVAVVLDFVDPLST